MSNLTYALKYARLGWAIVPVLPGDKKPITSHGVKNATTDERTITRWYRQHPSANIAVATGERNRILVVDVDPRNGGFTSLSDVELENEPLPITVYQRSGGGGEHYIYRYPVLNCKGRLRSKFRQGIDILGNGRYFVVEPSIHPSNRRYQWINDPWNTSIADPPTWLLNKITHLQEPNPVLSCHSSDPAVIDRARRYLDHVPPAVAGHNGNVRTYTTIVKVMYGFLLNDADTLSLISEWNQRCDPPWTQRELVTKIRYARNHGRFTPGIFI